MEPARIPAMALRGSLEFAISAVLLQPVFPATVQLPQGAEQPDVEVLDVASEAGPFELKDQRFTVVLHSKHIAGPPAPDPEFQTTLAEIEIKDAAGAVHYRASFPYEISGNEFSESLSASAELLQGRERAGLLLTYGVIPSTPLGGQSWQVFGLFDGRLVPLSKPIYAEGDLINVPEGPADRRVVRTAPAPGLQGEVLNFRVWTGNFFVIYPVRLDFLMAKAMPAFQCFRMTAQGNRPSCQYRVETDRLAQEEELTFVRLHAEAEEGMGTPQHVVVKQDSRVDFLAAEGEVQWDEDDRGVGLTPGDDFWLKLRIDGKEGWIHTQEDFLAIGLPQAG